MIISDLSFFEDTCEVSGICGGDYYAAVAVSPSGGDGVAWNYSTLSGAQTRALQEFNSLNTDCELRFNFQSDSPITGTSL